MGGAPHSLCLSSIISSARIRLSRECIRCNGLFSAKYGKVDAPMKNIGSTPEVVEIVSLSREARFHSAYVFGRLSIGIHAHKLPAPLPSRCRVPPPPQRRGRLICRDLNAYPATAGKGDRLRWKGRFERYRHCGYVWMCSWRDYGSAVL